MASPGKLNLRNPAVKRILQELKEIKAENSRDYTAEALEDDIFQWHFAIKGPPDTDFESGIYHGRILLPPEYPFKPPSFLMLSPTGRFETNVKVCLSISSHHPEHWQPSWSIRTALMALIAFLPTAGNGAIGSLDYPKEERMELARKSRLAPPVYGNGDRQELMQDMHRHMLGLEATCTDGDTTAIASSGSKLSTNEAIVANAVTEINAESHAREPDQVRLESEATPQSATLQQQQNFSMPVASLAMPLAQRQAAGNSAPMLGPTVSLGRPGPRQLATGSAAARQVWHMFVGGTDSSPEWEDRGLTLLATMIVCLIAAILFRRILTFAAADISSPL